MQTHHRKGSVLAGGGVEAQGEVPQGPAGTERRWLGDGAKGRSLEPGQELRPESRDSPPVSSRAGSRTPRPPQREGRPPATSPAKQKQP